MSFATFVLPLLSGLVPLSALYLLAWRAHLNIGHWPRYMLDDPNNFQFNDPWYDRLDGLTCIADGIGWCCLYASIALTIRFSPQITMRRRIIMVCLFLVSWTVFVHEPNQLFWWRLD
ncbi:hypothetical protein CCAX7_57730 [Capsulimonas corticalis]|uniref:Uncharacterized protein n=1 Tax=Capsulimonas corticalis TaxID=2219043 RepID=A0A402D0B5_9BACT|nr:hypothetical protein CCAX7_57730 [Capsulimonas corticalis]